MLLGDSNIDLLKIKIDKFVAEYVTLTMSEGCINLINKNKRG